jgi:hypothetical protein
MARIYKVLHGGVTTLVRADNANQAIRFIADRDITAAVATQDELLELGRKGAPVLSAWRPREENPDAAAEAEAERTKGSNE